MTPNKQTQSTTTPNPAVVAAAIAVPVKSKQTLEVEKLIAALIETRKLNAKKIETKLEGSKVVLLIAGWPRIEVGKGGGVNLPTIKSYANAFEAALIADQKQAAQDAREAKAAAAKALPPAPPKPVAKADAPKATEQVAK
jgi:hypothetical protein